MVSFVGHRVVRRARLLAARSRERDRWAAAAAAAAGAGAWAAADLLASVCSSSTATAGLFDVKLLQNNQDLLLQCCSAPRSFCTFPGCRAQGERAGPRRLDLLITVRPPIPGGRRPLNT